MNAEKHRRLDAVINEVQRKWGARALRQATDTHARLALPPVSIGNAALDQLTGLGGLPRKAIVEFVGVPGAGLHTQAFTMISQAQSNGNGVAYLDLDAAFDPDAAAACGVALPKLALVRPYTTMEAFDIAVDLVRLPGTGVVVWDALTSPLLAREPRSVITSALRRLKFDLAHSSFLVLFLSPVTRPAADTLLAPFANLRLHFENSRWIWHHQDIVGYEVQVTVIRNSFGLEGGQATIKIRL